MLKSNLYASVEPAPNAIPRANADGKIAAGWIAWNQAEPSVIITDTTLDETHSIVLVSGTIELTIPNPDGINGRLYNIIRIGDGDVTITPDGSVISGDTNLVLTSQWDSVVILAVDLDGVKTWVRCS